MENLLKMALTADDLWLKVMSIKKNTKVASIAGEYSRFFIPIIIKHNPELMNINIMGGQNDLIFDALLKHYKIPVAALME